MSPTRNPFSGHHDVLFNEVPPVAPVGGLKRFKLPPVPEAPPVAPPVKVPIRRHVGGYLLPSISSQEVPIRRQMGAYLLPTINPHEVRWRAQHWMISKREEEEEEGRVEAERRELAARRHDAARQASESGRERARRRAQLVASRSVSVDGSSPRVLQPSSPGQEAIRYNEPEVLPPIQGSPRPPPPRRQVASLTPRRPVRMPETEGPGSRSTNLCPPSPAMQRPVPPKPDRHIQAGLKAALAATMEAFWREREQQEQQQQPSASRSSSSENLNGRLRQRRSKKEKMRFLARQAKTRRNFEARRQLFEELPADEQTSLEAAWMTFAQEDPTDAVDPQKLFDSLPSLGLKFKSDAIKKEVERMCEDATLAPDFDFHSFALDLVPDVRETLRARQRRVLLEQFLAFDEDGSGLLSSARCVEILKKYCASCMDIAGFEELLKYAMGLYSSLQQADTNCLDFEAFQVFITSTVERKQRVHAERERKVLEEHSLSPELVKAFAEELLPLLETYQEQDYDRNGGLDRDEVRGALLEMGLVPHGKEEILQMDVALYRAMEEAGPLGLDFPGFLELIRLLRKERRRGNNKELRALFQHYDKDHSGSLSLPEVSQLFVELGLAPRCQEDQDEIRRLLADIDVDGSGELSFSEFEELTHRTGEKLAIGRRRQEKETALQLGFTPQEVAELREAFFRLDADGNGKLCIDECRRTLKLLKQDMSSEELRDFFCRLDNDGDDELDFLEFMSFMHSIQDSIVSQAIVARSKRDHDLGPSELFGW